MDSTQKTIIIEALATIDGLSLVVLFGSAVSGQLRQDSDIDLAVKLVAPDHSPEKLDAIREKVALATGRPVDLVDLAEANGPLLRTILNDGKVLVENDPHARGFLAERLLDWQEDFYPCWKKMHEARLKSFIEPTHA